MTDISRFGFAIDSSQAVTAYENLDKMAESARRMEARAQRMERATQDMSRRMADLVRQQETYNRTNQATQTAVGTIIDNNERLTRSYATLSAQILAVNIEMTKLAEKRYEEAGRPGISMGERMTNIASMAWRGSTEPGGAWKMVGEWLDSGGRESRERIDSMQELSRVTETLGRDMEVTARQLRLYDEATRGLQSGGTDLARLIDTIGKMSRGTANQIETLRRALGELGLEMSVLTENSETEWVNIIGGKLNEIQDPGDRNRLAQALGFTPEMLADTRIGVRQVGEEQKKHFEWLEIAAQRQQEREDRQARRQRERLEILAEIEAAEQRIADIRAEAGRGVGDAFGRFWEGPNDPTMGFFERFGSWVSEAGTGLRNLTSALRDYVQAQWDPEAYAARVSRQTRLPSYRQDDEANDPSFVFHQLRQDMQQPEIMFDFEAQAERQLAAAQEYLSAVKAESSENIELIQMAEDNLHQARMRYFQMFKSQSAEAYQFHLTTALTALGREKMELEELNRMWAVNQQSMRSGGPMIYSPADIRRQNLRLDVAMRAAEQHEHMRDLQSVDAAGRRQVDAARIGQAGANRAAATGGAPRVAAVGAAIGVAEAQAAAQFNRADVEHQHLLKQMADRNISMVSKEGADLLAASQAQFDQIQQNLDTQRALIGMQAGMNADMQQYQEERRNILLQDALIWSNALPERRRLQERLAQADMELAEEYGRGTAAHAAAFAQRAQVIEQNMRDETELGLRTSLADQQREIELNEGLGAAYAEGANAVREFNIERQVSMQAAALAAAGHDLESEAMQELLATYRQLHEDRERQAREQMQGQTTRARTLEIQALEKETSIAGRLPLERQREMALFREEQRLKEAGVEGSNLTRGVAEYNTLLNAQAERDFETSQSDRLVNSARNAARQIEATLADGLTNAAIHGTDSFESFFANLGRMAQQTAAEIARVMVIQPLIGSAMQGLGFGNLAAELGYAALTMHSGGTAGSDGAVRVVPSWMAAGAQRYHQGTSSAGGPALAPNEVLTILEKGEKVTPRNAETGGNLNVTNNISVNGGSGGEEASAELARSIAREIDVHLEQKMAKFAIRQRRVGGLLRST